MNELVFGLSSACCKCCILPSAPFQDVSFTFLPTRCQCSASKSMKVVNTPIKWQVMLCLFILEAHKTNCTYYIYSIYKVVYFVILAQSGVVSFICLIIFFANGQ